MIDVTSKVEAYEVDGEEVAIGKDRPSVTVSSHWNRAEFVVLNVNGKTLTFSAGDLKAAIENATRNNRHA